MSERPDIAARSQPFVVARQPDDNDEFNDEEKPMTRFMLAAFFFALLVAAALLIPATIRLDAALLARPAAAAQPHDLATGRCIRMDGTPYYCTSTGAPGIPPQSAR